MQHRETPSRRRNPSGKQVWIARYTAPDGKRRSAGTFGFKRDAQAAIDAAYEMPTTLDTVGAYAATWVDRHPRSRRTNTTNQSRIRALLNVKLEGRELQHWLLTDLRRRHAYDLIGHMLTVQGRATSGAVDVLRAYSAMCEDAITDELMVGNPFKGVRVRSNDPRVQKKAREPQVFSMEDLHRFAACARTLQKGNYEPMLRTLIDCGLRLGETVGLERRDLHDGLLSLRGNAHSGVFTPGDTPTKKHVRQVPVPPTLDAMLADMPKRIDTPLLFPTPRGRMWMSENFRRDIWAPTQKASGMNVRPHDARHSWVTQMRAAGIDAADLADMAGHSIDTASARYTHALRRSYEDVRNAVG